MTGEARPDRPARARWISAANWACHGILAVGLVAPSMTYVPRMGGATDVARATLIGWDPETYLFTVWTLIGTLSTISNGGFLLFTAPAWQLGGWLATAAQSKRPILRSDQVPWLDLRLYARFPQGLPPELDLTSLGTVQLGRPLR